MNEKTVRSLEKGIKTAFLEVITDMGLKRLLLLPSHQTMHLMAKAAVAVYEAAVENHERSWATLRGTDPGLIALDLGRRPVLVEQSGEDRRERVTSLNRFEIPGAVGMDLIGFSQRMVCQVDHLRA